MPANSLARTRALGLALVKIHAAGRWLELIPALSSQTADLFDGRKKPCPRCGGNDRFRAFDDFNQEGGVVCSQCHDKRNRDGFATLQWLTGWTFPETVRAVAAHLGMIDATGRRPAILPAIAKPAEAKPAEAKPAAEKPHCESALEFQDWNDSLAAIWCLKKAPIKLEALKAFGARIAKYQGRFICIALPIWGASLDAAPPVGWLVYNAAGGTLPTKDGPAGKKITWGSDTGIIGTLERLRDRSTRKIKTEGPTDGLALFSLVDESTAVFCNACGAIEKPEKEQFAFLPSLAENSSFICIGDADKAGEEGAARWSNFFASFAEKSSIARLPYEVVPSHGKDLRNWITEGNGREELEAIIAAAEVVKHVPTEPEKPKQLELPEDPHRLARANLEAYRTEHNGELKFWRGQWLKWKRNRYQFLTKEEIEAKVNARIKVEFDRQWMLDQKRHLELLATDPDYSKEPPSVRRVTAPIVRDTLAALRSMCTVSSSVEMGSWLVGRDRRKYLACRNCILDIAAFVNDATASTACIKHSPNWFSSACLEYDFDPTAVCPIWEEVLAEIIGDEPGKLELAQEFAGYILSPDNTRSKFLALEGEGGNGKSLFTNAIQAIVGRENTSSVNLDVISKRFQSFPTLGKMLNVCQESNDIEGAESFLKNFTGGNPMMFESKGANAFEALPTAKLLLSWNVAPRFKDRSEGLWRRMLVLKFNRKPARPNPKLLEPDFWLRNGQLAGMLNWALLGLKRLESQGEFTVPSESLKATEEIRAANNSARLFIRENIEYAATHGDDIPSIECKLVYEAYSGWCKQNGLLSFGSPQFGRELNQFFRDRGEIKKNRPRNGDSREYHYLNISMPNYLFPPKF